MKYIAYVALAVAVVAAQPEGGEGGKGGKGMEDMEIDSAGGACGSSADCSTGEYCVFTVDKSGDEPVWSPSYCGVEADCGAPSPDEEPTGPPEGAHSFCEEFMMMG